jgi:hypothetical protein
MSSITTTSFEPLMPESLEDRWIDYYSGRETSPYCNGSAVSLPFRVGTPLAVSENCPPGADAPPDFDGVFGTDVAPDAAPTDEPPVAESPSVP